MYIIVTSTAKSISYNIYYQVYQLTSNGKSHNIVKEYLQNLEGIVSIESSKYEEFITAVAPVSVWENIFETKFIVVANAKSKNIKDKINSIISKEKNDRMAIRTLQYKLPKILRGHVTTVLNTVQAPQFEKNKKVINSSKKIDSKIISEINDLNKYSDVTDNNDVTTSTTNKADNDNKIEQNKFENNDDKKRKFTDLEEKQKIAKRTKLSEKNPKRKSISFGFTFPRLLNDVYNIMSNTG